tara:strand:+ start:297 stop:524 length:228 start_codon:yes stop_codon:yes gene_type:complete
MDSKSEGIPLVIFSWKTRSPLVFNINKSLCEAPQLLQASPELLSAQTGELLLEVQLPEEELWEPFATPINSTLYP